MRLNEIEVDEITGWVWVPKEDASNPFDDYIHHFYKLKNESRDNFPLYTQRKLLLNSLYGNAASAQITGCPITRGQIERELEKLEELYI